MSSNRSRAFKIIKDYKKQNAAEVAKDNAIVGEEPSIEVKAQLNKENRQRREEARAAGNTDPLMTRDVLEEKEQMIQRRLDTVAPLITEETAADWRYLAEALGRNYDFTDFVAGSQKPLKAIPRASNPEDDPTTLVGLFATVARLNDQERFGRRTSLKKVEDDQLGRSIINIQRSLPDGFKLRIPSLGAKGTANDRPARPGPLAAKADLKKAEDEGRYRFKGTIGNRKTPIHRTLMADRAAAIDPLNAAPLGYPKPIKDALGNIISEEQLGDDAGHLIGLDAVKKAFTDTTTGPGRFALGYLANSPSNLRAQGAFENQQVFSPIEDKSGFLKDKAGARLVAGKLLEMLDSLRQQMGNAIDRGDMVLASSIQQTLETFPARLQELGF